MDSLQDCTRAYLEASGCRCRREEEGGSLYTFAARGEHGVYPVLLEPIYSLDITVPDEYMGDIIGDMNRRRGRVLGMNPVEDGQEVVVEVPLSEIFKYATDLRAMTQGRGSFTKKFVRYEEVPANIAQKIIASANLPDDDE